MNEKPASPQVASASPMDSKRGIIGSVLSGPYRIMAITWAILAVLFFLIAAVTGFQAFWSQGRIADGLWAFAIGLVVNGAMLSFITALMAIKVWLQQRKKPGDHAAPIGHLGIPDSGPATPKKSSD